MFVPTATNGDLNDDSFDQDLYDLGDDDTAALTAAGYTGFPTTGDSTTEPFPYWLCLAQVLQNDTGGDPSSTCNGVITRTQDKQNSYGLSGLATWRTKTQSALCGRRLGSGHVHLPSAHATRLPEH